MLAKQHGKNENTAAQHNKPDLRVLQISSLKPGVYQPRKTFDNNSLESLAATIQQVGILEPLVVRPIDGNRYEIIAGERRWRAAQLARLQEVPCLIKSYSDEQAAQVALIENTCRENLNSLEEAKAIQRIIDEFEYTHEEVGAMLGIARSTVGNLLRLLKLDKRLQSWLSDGSLSEAHGRILAGVAIDQQYKLAHDCVSKKWSTRKLEKTIKQSVNSKKIEPSHKKDIYVRRIEHQLSDKLGYPVTINIKKNEDAGSFHIDFTNLDHMQGILKKLGYEEE